MSVPVILFAIRLLSALLLLLFLGGLGWIMAKEMRVSAAVEPPADYIGRLRVIAAEGEQLPVGTLFALTPLTSIGRSERSSIVIDDSYASAEHALLMLRGRQWYLEDLDSRNGTLLNDVPVVDTVVVSSGDIIAIGETQLKLELTETTLPESGGNGSES